MNRTYRLVWSRPRGVLVAAGLVLAGPAHAAVTCDTNVGRCDFSASGDNNAANLTTTGTLQLHANFGGGTATQSGAITGSGGVSLGSNYYAPQPTFIFVGGNNSYTGLTTVTDTASLQIGTLSQAGVLPGDVTFAITNTGSFFVGNLYLVNATGFDGSAYAGTVSHAQGVYLSGNTTLGAATIDATSAQSGHAGGIVDVDGHANTGAAHIFGFSTLSFASTTDAGTSVIDAPETPPGFSTTVQFLDQSSADHATINNNAADGYSGAVYFGAQATAGSATINNGDPNGMVEANTIASPGRNTVQFWNQATAGSSTIYNDNGYLLFDYDSTADQAQIHNRHGGILDFFDLATAGQATISNESGSSIAFEADTTAGTATFQNAATANIDISQNNASTFSIAHITGDGDIYLGDHALILGSGNGNDEAGALHDGIGPAFADYGAAATTGGRLEKTGTGTLVLSGDSTYTGGTTIDSGVLQLGRDGASGSVVGDITDNGTLAFQRSDTYTFDATIRGSGALVQRGSGTTILAGDQAFTGGTTITAGTLQLGSGGSHGSVIGDISNAGTLAFDRADTYAFTGVISGTGRITQNGTGTTVFTADQAYTGGTTITAGTLQLGNGGTAGSLVGDITDDGVLLVNRADELHLTGSIKGTGRLVQAGSGTTVLAGAASYTGGTTITHGTLRVTDSGQLNGAVSNASHLVFDTAGSQVFAGTLSGAGDVAKQGTGTLAWNATGTGTGTTTLAAGSLVLGDAIHPGARLGGDLAQAAGTVLSGFGTVGGDALLNGVVAPGDATAVGTLQITGDAVFGTQSLYRVKVRTDGTSDLLTIGGTAALAGSVLALPQGEDYQPSTTYTIITAAGGISGQFAAVASDFAFLQPTITYAANAAQFTLLRNATTFEQVGLTRNQIDTGTAIGTLATGNPVYDTVVLMDAEQARGAYDALSGEIHASVQTRLVDDSRQVRDAMSDRLFDRDGTDGQVRGDHAEAWTRTLGGNGTQRGSRSLGSAGASGNGSGILGGMDVPVGDQASVGIMGGRGYGTLDVRDRASSATTHGTYAGVYGGGQMGALVLQGGAAYDWNYVRTTRRIAVPGLEQRVTADYHAPVQHAFVEAAVRVATGHGALFPYVRAAATRIDADAFTEHGNGVELETRPRRQTTPSSTVGLRTAWEPDASDRAAVSVHANVGWQHAYGSLPSRRDVSFTSGGDPFEIFGTALPRDAAVASAGVQLSLGRRVSVGLDASGLFAHGSRQTGASAQLKIDL